MIYLIRQQLDMILFWDGIYSIMSGPSYFRRGGFPVEPHSRLQHGSAASSAGCNIYGPFKTKRKIECLKFSHHEQLKEQKQTDFFYQLCFMSDKSDFTALVALGYCLYLNLKYDLGNYAIMLVDDIDHFFLSIHCLLSLIQGHGGLLYPNYLQTRGRVASQTGHQSTTLYFF